MAIDYNAGISSLKTGAPDIKLTGNQDPREPNQKFAGGGQRGWMAQELAMEIAEEEYGRDFYDLNDSLQMKIYSRALQEIDDMLMDKMGRAQNREGIQMASAADPMLQEEYDKYVFEMQEMGQQPMSFEQFREQAVAGMATGGRVPDIGFSKVQPSKDGSRPGYFRAALRESEKAGESISPRTSIVANVRGQEKMREETDLVPPPDLSILSSSAGEDNRISTAVDQYTSGTGLSQKARQDLKKQREKTIREIREGNLGYKKDKDRKITLPKLNALIGPEAWYGLAQGLPGAKTSLLKQRAAYKKYLDSLGLTSDWFDEEDIEDYDLYKRLLGMERPTTEYGMDPGMTYAEFLASGAASKSGVGNFNLLARGNLGNLANLKKPDNIMVPGTKRLMTDAEWEQLKRASGQGASSYDRGPSREKALEDRIADDPCSGPNPPAWCTSRDDDPGDDPGDDEDDGYIRFESSYAPEHLANIQQMHGGVLPSYYGADGGRAGYAGGGITDLRQGYFIGKLVKSLTKPFKGITRGVKKLMKSPAGKMAMLAALGYGTGMFGKGQGLAGLKKSLIGGGWMPTAGKMKPGVGAMFSPKANTGFLGKLLLSDPSKTWSMANISPIKSILMAMGIGSFMGGEDDKLKGYDYGKLNELRAYYDDLYKDSGKRIRFVSDGGRIGYAEGGDNEDLTHKQKYLKGVKYAQEGGLMDLGGMEKDYRNEGGFVPIGGQERADDVPARLSKNEFVFTADAVRAAGGGDIDRGAEIMENVMENLEQGGQVSEESQGLEGARDMFATAQRLEGVL